MSEEESVDSQSNLSPLEQRIEICDKASDLSYEDRLYILSILKQQLPSSSIIENADGSRINLDNLSDKLVNKIYHILIIKLKISKTDTI